MTYMKKGVGRRTYARQTLRAEAPKHLRATCIDKQRAEAIQKPLDQEWRLITFGMVQCSSVENLHPPVLVGQESIRRSSEPAAHGRGITSIPAQYIQKFAIMYVGSSSADPGVEHDSTDAVRTGAPLRELSCAMHHVEMSQRSSRARSIDGKRSLHTNTNQDSIK